MRGYESQEQFSVMRTLYMKNSHGFVVVYSITSRGTLDEAVGIYEQILREKDTDRAPAIFVANKCDLQDQRVVSKAEGEARSKAFSCKHIEASAKKRYNIDQIFYELVLSILGMQEKSPGDNKVSKPSRRRKPVHKCMLL
jgi:GTPase KRas